MTVRRSGFEVNERSRGAVASRLLVVLAAASVACGGNTSERDDPGAVGSAGGGGSAAAGAPSAGSTIGGARGGVGGTPNVADLRFQRIAVGRGRFCGITRDDARLICVADGRIQSERVGPYLDVAISEDTMPWSAQCAVLGTGELECEEPMGWALPAGPFGQVTLGFFNACARGPRGVACWVDADGGIEPPEHVVDDFSVEMYSYCHRPAPLHAECVSRGTSLLPNFAHYLDVVAAPSSGCAALLATPKETIPETVPPELAAVVGRSQIACFAETGETQVKLAGEFRSLDVNVNSDGCAIRSRDAGIECWGELAGDAPVRSVGARQVSVSTSLRCVLWEDGAVDCW